MKYKVTPHQFAKCNAKFRDYILKGRKHCCAWKLVLCKSNRRIITVFLPLAARGDFQSHFRWALIKTFISQFFSLKQVIFEEKNQWKII